MMVRHKNSFDPARLFFPEKTLFGNITKKSLTDDVVGLEQFDELLLGDLARHVDVCLPEDLLQLLGPLRLPPLPHHGHHLGDGASKLVLRLEFEAGGFPNIFLCEKKKKWGSDEYLMKVASASAAVAIPRPPPLRPICHRGSIKAVRFGRGEREERGRGLMHGEEAKEEGKREINGFLFCPCPLYCRRL